VSGNCQKPETAKSEYCKHHCCFVSGCHAGSRIDCYYCEEHAKSPKCGIPECNSGISILRRYCGAHQCQFDGCLKKKVAQHMFCAFHRG
jgi:hypothetical protein